MQPAADLERLRTEYEHRARRLASDGRYSVFNPGNLFIHQQRQRALLQLLKQKGYDDLQRRSILEVGCGEGGLLAELALWGASGPQTTGIDLLPARLARAAGRVPARLACADGQSLPFAPASFDLVFQFTALSSVLDDDIRHNMADEMLRVLKRPGLIVWYDFWLNPSNPHTRGIGPEEIRRLFKGGRFDFRRITLAPPLAYRLVPLSWLLAAALEKLQLFNSHYLVAIQPAQ